MWEIYYFSNFKHSKICDEKSTNLEYRYFKTILPLDNEI